MDLPQTTEMPESDYRQYLPDLTIPRFATMARQNAHEYAADFKSNGQPPWLHALYMHWLELLKEPYHGVTSDGKVQPDLYKIEDEGLPVEKIVSAADQFISQLDDNQKNSVFYHIDDPQWRTWSNPEFLLFNKGIRLDEVNASVRNSCLNLLASILSPEGYEKAISAMRINGFLGQLVSSSKVCNEYSYNICFFGTPSTQQPWGLSFYGHHLCLNIFIYQRQLIIAPWFTGAEPNIIDAGPYAGTRILHEEERLGLGLMQSLAPELQTKAQTYKQMHDPLMPKGRWNHDDQRHLCGAYRDNRIVPYEGVNVGQNFNESQTELLIGILTQYLLYLPQRSRDIKIRHVREHFDETYFSWIGPYESTNKGEPAFYFRIQSPVILIEFDHHGGVFLTNKEPARFHIHTILRLPNAGDYGVALRRVVGEEGVSGGRVRQEWIWEGDKMSE